MFRSVLIRPSNVTGSAYLTKWGFLPVPLGILQLAGCLLSMKNSVVKVIDMEADSTKDVDSVVEETLKFNPELVGLTLHATAAHKTATKIARRVKELSPRTVTVAGGHHATFLPHELLRDGFDIAVMGEGDYTIMDIAEAIQIGSSLSVVKGIMYRKGDGSFVRTARRPLIADLDALPLPALDLVNKEPYTFRTFGDKERVTCIETSRGCPYACDFCSVTPTWGNKWRNKSVDRILMELDMVKRLGYNWVFFTDDIFIVYPNVAQRSILFDRMIERDYGLKFIVQMRADVTAKNPELIKKGAQAGMSVAFLGIESGSPEILKKMHKGILTSSAVVAVRTLSQNGIIVLGGMMLGAPYESLSEMITTVRFAHKLADVGLDAVQFSLYTPLPGTRIFDDAIRNNQLFTLDWDRYDLLTPVMRTRVHPVITQIMQACGNYSFYILKYIKGKLLRRKEIGHKEKLVKNATKFIFDMMPEYLRDILAFPGVLLRTAREYNNRTVLTKERVQEILQLSNTIIYEEVGGKNPYFMIKES